MGMGSLEVVSLDIVTWIWKCNPIPDSYQLHTYTPRRMLSFPHRMLLFFFPSQPLFLVAFEN